MSISELENKKNPQGHVTLIGLGRLGLRIALHLIQVHRGGPEKITLIDGQRISGDDIIFRSLGAQIGEYKADFIKNYSHPQSLRQIHVINEFITPENLDLIVGDVVSIQIAGGDTLPTTAMIINHVQPMGAKTISTMGVFGIGEEPVRALDIDSADPENPIVHYLISQKIHDHMLVGTGKLIRDWEPVTAYVLDKVSEKMTGSILQLLHEKHSSGCIS